MSKAKKREILHNILKIKAKKIEIILTEKDDRLFYMVNILPNKIVIQDFIYDYAKSIRQIVNETILNKKNKNTLIDKIVNSTAKIHSITLYW